MIAAADAEADGWLVAPYIHNVEVNVVRCFRHISEHALRSSFAGRTDHWRKKMIEGRERAAAEGPLLHPFFEPFPMEDHP